MTATSLLSVVKNTALLFPGQGSQHVGMAHELADAYPVARQTLAEADEILGFALSKLMFDGPEEVLTDTINAQPALLAASIAALRSIEAELGTQTAPAAPGEGVYVAGHSLGEYTALVAAGSLSYADGLRLVRERGRLMKEAGTQKPGMMAAVLGLDEAQVARVCAETTVAGGIAQVANDNCPGQIVISGDPSGMSATMAALSAAGAKKVVPLAVSIAAHSPLMKPAAVALRAAIDATPVQAPAVPILGNTSGAPLTEVAAIRDELSNQLTGSVRWTATLQWLADAGVTSFVEIGPGEVLSGLVKRVARGATRINLSQPEAIRAYVAGLRIVD
ncbi:MAG: ACP S-malonyltransferase [Anaerolineales bacterium]|nr:ACP S-malonyltransferase [Anaerolineales bacterium]